MAYFPMSDCKIGPEYVGRFTSSELRELCCGQLDKSRDSDGYPIL